MTRKQSDQRWSISPICLSVSRNAVVWHIVRGGRIAEIEVVQ